eukprot:Phypoly_transcript_01012.p1 GENE.Phypoly_transcript_01012~~Phypoly_transcript_01012.p1  ORF type:complete len:1088 (-),score=117.46 Phypoly_transcript_01012:536-3649(-)
MNEDATLSSSLSVPTTYACLDLSGSQNSVLRGDSFSIAAIQGSFNSGVAILINSATNLTITGLNFASSRIYVTNSVNVIITQCSFSGGITGTLPGIWTNQVNGLVVTNNSFSVNATVYSNSSSNINVRANTFTNIQANPNVLDLVSPYHFSVVNNVFVNIVAPTAICVWQTTTNLDSGGDVSGNSILGGTLSNPIYVEIYGNVGFTVTNNVVSGVTGSCVDFYGFKITGQTISTFLTFSNNAFENFYHPCPQTTVYAAQIWTTTIFEMNNNIFNNLTVENVNQHPAVSVVVIYNCNGMGTNLTISNVVVSDQSRSSNMLTGVYVHSDDGTNGISITGLVIQNLEGGKAPDCAIQDTACTSAAGWSIAGVYTTGSFTGYNIFMSDFTGGDGGLISNTTTGSDIGGGAVLGIVSNPPATTFITISNITLQNFKAGNSGNFHPGATGQFCGLGGGTIYYSTPSTTYAPYTIGPSPPFTQMEVYDMVCGQGSCQSFGLGTPANTVVTLNRTSFTLSWSKNSGIAYSIDIVKSSNWSNVYNGTDNLHAVTGLNPASNYTARLYSTQGSATSDYVYFFITTNPITIPAPPSEPTFNEFSSSTISVSWTPSDDGGSPVTNFTLQMFSNSVWSTVYAGVLTTYQVVGLDASTAYQFRVAASNALGLGFFSEISSTSTAARACGDGICDPGLETCHNCFLDCGACGFPSCPGTPECNGGTCVNGTCSCPSGYSGSGCEFKSSPFSVRVNAVSPFSTVALLSTNTETPKFTIGFHDIQEVDVAGKVVTPSPFDFSQLSFASFQGKSSPAWNETIFNITLSNKAIITVNLFVVAEDSSFSFANQTVKVAANSVKYSMRISKWPFMKYGNQLKVTMVSGDASQKSTKDECVYTQTDDNNNNLLWVQMKVNGAVLYGTFSADAIIDGSLKRVQYSYNSPASLVEITVPFFWNQTEFDPNFQVLLDYNKDDKCSHGKKSGFFTIGTIAGISVGAVVVIAIIVGVTVFVVRKRKNAKRTKAPPKPDNYAPVEPMAGQRRRIIGLQEDKEEGL